MLANLLIKLLEHTANIAEGLFWLGIVVILLALVSMIFISAVIVGIALFA